MADEVTRIVNVLIALKPEFDYRRIYKLTLSPKAVACLDIKMQMLGIAVSKHLTVRVMQRMSLMCWYGG